jgi:hypothetical protein
MKRHNGEKQAAAIGMQAYGDAGSQIADIIARMNAIDEDPLRRMEAEQLRRAYVAAVVRYFDRRRVAER